VYEYSGNSDYITVDFLYCQVSSDGWASAAATTGMFSPERIYVFGADADLPYWQLTFRNFTTKSYNSKTDKLKACASMLTGRFDAGVAEVNDTLYVIGGFTTEFLSDRFTPNPSITYSAAIEQYIPSAISQSFRHGLICCCF
jgi:hypothetical protein